MVSARRRLEDLEARNTANDPQRKIPPETNVLLKAVARHRAVSDGEIPPPYSDEELQTLYEGDLADADDGTRYPAPDEPGWQTDEGRELLDHWQTQARKRLERIRNGETLTAVYNEMDANQREEQQR